MRARGGIRWAALVTVLVGGGCHLIVGLEEAEVIEPAAGSPCADGVRNGGESDVDCGGACSPCDDEKGCLVGTDCESLVCIGGLCRSPKCDDGVTNGSETDVDCGGGCEPKCVAGQSCVAAEDCEGGACSSGVCLPVCTDGVKNGKETDTDCGGDECTPCVNGKTCVSSADCGSGVCHQGVCASLHVWSKRFGDSASQSGQSIAVDTPGNVLIAGILQGSIDFGGGALTSLGTEDVFIAKFSESGEQVWSKRLGDSASQSNAQVAVDASGNVFTACTGKGSVDFGGGPLSSAGENDVFIAGLSASGNHQWSKHFGDDKNQKVTNLAIDGSGSVVLAGGFEGTITLGAFNKLTANSGSQDTFVAKLSAAGGHIWSKQLNVTGGTISEGLAVTNSGGVIVSGYFSGSFDVGDGPITSDGFGDIFVIALDALGNHVWSKRFGSDGFDLSTGVAVDAEGNTILVGLFHGVVSFGETTLESKGDWDFFVAKLDPKGDLLWSKRVGDTNLPRGSTVAVDDASNILIAGNFKGTVDFGGGTFVSDTSRNVFLAKLDASGNHLWSGQFGSLVDDEDIRAIGFSPTGTVSLTGEFRNVIDFGGGELVSAGSNDVFLATLTLP